MSDGTVSPWIVFVNHQFVIVVLEQFLSVVLVVFMFTASIFISNLLHSTCLRLSLWLIWFDCRVCDTSAELRGAAQSCLLCALRGCRRLEICLPPADR